MRADLEDRLSRRRGKPPTGIFRGEGHPLDAIFTPHNVAVIGATEKAASLGGIGGMHADIKRREAHGANAVEIAGGEVGQCDVVTVEERVAVVVVAKFEPRAQFDLSRPLIDETERAFVRAFADRRILDIDAEQRAVRPLDRGLKEILAASKENRELRFGRIEVQIDPVVNGLAIEHKDMVFRAQTGIVSGCAGMRTQNENAFVATQTILG